VKKYEKRLIKMFLTEDEVLMEQRHCRSKYQSEIFNFVDLCSRWTLCGRPQPKHESVMHWCHCCHFLR